MDIRFGTWNVTSPYREFPLKTILRKWAKYNFDLVTVKEVRWHSGSSKPPDVYICIYMELRIQVIT